MKAMMIAAVSVAAFAMPAYAQAMTAKEYVAAAGAGDLYEKQSSQIVLASTTNPAVRDFAKMMITQHTKSTQDVKAAAKASKLKPMPPKLMPAQAEMIAKLNAEKGQARDMTYISQQKMAHAQALALHQAYARDGTAKPLRNAASMIVPVVEHHIEMLKTM